MRLNLSTLPSLPAQAAPGATLAGQAYELIKLDLFEFRMLPGDDFTEGELAARFGVSRTPVRQALYRLEREGFVLLRQRGGWRVRPFDFERFEALYDVRIVLEQAAVARLCGLHNMDVGGEMPTLKRVWLVSPIERQRGGRQVAELDEAFHCALVAAAGNPEMAQIHRDVTEKIRILRQMDFTEDHRVDATYMEHGAILRAILARRADEATRMLKSHIEISKSEVRKITLHRMEMARREGLRRSQAP
ncbi:MAG TPA: GntR family transcriptional regulator [Bordetella sp.]|nr:GntR family transcriptional regulator [Bordetella sp.]